MDFFTFNRATVGPAVTEYLFFTVSVLFMKSQDEVHLLFASFLMRVNCMCVMLHDARLHEFSDDDCFRLNILPLLCIYYGSIFSVFGAFGGVSSSRLPAMDVLRSMCCFLCLQAEGGIKAGAVATVVAAVDLARVRQPVHAEGGRAEEEEVVESEISQQAATTAEKHVAMKTLPVEPPAAVAMTSEQHRVQVSQVGGVAEFILDI